MPMASSNPVRKVLADAKRVKMKVFLTCKCLTCEHEHTHRITWFERLDFNCPDCGGKLVQEPLVQMTQSAVKSVNEALKRFANPSRK